MDKIVEIFSKLSELKLSKEKDQFIKLHKDNIEFLELLSKNLDPYAQYCVDDIPDIESKNNNHNPHEQFINLLNTLLNGSLEHNDKIEEIKKLFSDISKERQQIYKKVITKENFNIDAKTVNKALNKPFIKEFKVLLPPHDRANLTKIYYPVLVNPKLNGIRALYIPFNDDVLLYDKTGLIFKNNNIKKRLKNLRNTKTHVLDGLLYAKGYDIENLSTILNLKNTEIPRQLKFILFDCVPLKDWKNQNCNLPYQIRLKQLRNILNDQICDYDNIIDMPSDFCTSPKQVLDLYKIYLKSDNEGIILRNPNLNYEWKRTTLKGNNIVKLYPTKQETK